MGLIDFLSVIRRIGAERAQEYISSLSWT